MPEPGEGSLRKLGINGRVNISAIILRSLVGDVFVKAIFQVVAAFNAIIPVESLDLTGANEVTVRTLE